GCSTFEQSWQSCCLYDNPADRVAGCWQGGWHSEVNGHQGTLRAIIEREAEGRYRARFKATFWRFFPFEFEMPLTVTPTQGGYAFAGEADLGLLAGGVFSYSGSIRGDTFMATYQSHKDQGTFWMERVSAAPGGEPDEVAEPAPADASAAANAPLILSAPVTSRPPAVEPPAAPAASEGPPVPDEPGVR
ncbi:MAG: hypothetical protein D6725_07640, partial [Planctomycetota bacterium]